MQNLKIIFVIGPPGAGKGTLCSRMAKQFGYVHFSVGDYLRDLSENGDSYPNEAFGGSSSEQIRSMLQTRALFDSEQIVAILLYKITQDLAQGHHTIVVDGFPRDHESAEAFEQQVR
jgi:UMP-CMP kinase